MGTGVRTLLASDVLHSYVGEGTSPDQIPALRGTALSSLARVFDESSTASNIKLDVEHTHPGLGCWSILHLPVSLTQKKPFGAGAELRDLVPGQPHWSGAQ